MKVLAVGCHPDDLEIACGGTLSRYVKGGAEVYMCHVANGSQGHVEIMPDQLKIIRARESENAGKIIGVRHVFNLDVNDMEVNRFDQRAVDAFAEVVRFVRPDVIITHNEQDYMQDHIETSRIVMNGSFASTLVHKATQKKGLSEAYPEFVPVFYMDTLGGVDFIPTHYVDITDHIEVKLRALACHETQVKWMMDHDHIDFLKMVKTCSEYRGYQCGVTFAEGFRPSTVYPRMTTKHLLP